MNNNSNPQPQQNLNQQSHIDQYSFYEGYAKACYDMGFKQGYSNGYNNGHIDGRQSGLYEGHNQGYQKGRQEDKTKTYELAYDTGHDDGYNEGFEKGQSTGYDTGYMKGKEDTENMRIQKRFLNNTNTHDNTNTVFEIPYDIESQLVCNSPTDTSEFTFNNDTSDLGSDVWKNLWSQTYDIPQYNLNTPTVLSWDNNDCGWSVSDNWYENWGNILEGHDCELTWDDTIKQQEVHEKSNKNNVEYENQEELEQDDVEQKSLEELEQDEEVEMTQFKYDREVNLQNIMNTESKDSEPEDCENNDSNNSESYSFNFDIESDDEELETCIVNGIFKELNEDILSF